MFWLFVVMMIILRPKLAAAAVDLTTVSIDFASIEATVGIVFVALLAMYGYRKFIKTGNRV